MPRGTKLQKTLRTGRTNGLYYYFGRLRALFSYISNLTRRLARLGHLIRLGKVANHSHSRPSHRKLLRLIHLPKLPRPVLYSRIFRSD